MKKFVLLAAIALLALTATSAQAAHHHRHHHHRTPPTTTAPAPEVLRPVVIQVPGELVAFCNTGIDCEDAPDVGVSSAQCPPGYTLQGGGWESYSGLGNASVTQNHAVSTNWIVVMEATVDAPFGTPPQRSFFRAVAQCQILLPA